MSPIMVKLNVILKPEYRNILKKTKGNGNCVSKMHFLFWDCSPDFEDFSIPATKLKITNLGLT